MSKENKENKSTLSSTSQKKKTCGLIMPISAIGEYDEEHWKEVKECLEDTITEMGFEVRMVSDSDLNLLIPSNIVQALFQDDIIICDISGVNPNVMFELGLRIGFNKSYIILFDEKQKIPFDINTISCLKYPSTLNKVQMKKFEKNLRERIEKTVQEEGNDFLKAYGKIKVYEPETEKVTVTEFQEQFLEKIDSFSNLITRVEYRLSKVEKALEKEEIIGTLSGREVEIFIRDNPRMLRLINELPFEVFISETIKIFEIQFPNRPRNLLEAAIRTIYERIRFENKINKGF